MVTKVLSDFVAFWMKSSSKLSAEIGSNNECDCIWISLNKFLSLTIKTIIYSIYYNYYY